MGYKSGVILGPIALNASGTAATNIATGNTGTVTIGNSALAVDFKTNCGASGINLGCTANAHTTTIGSSNADSLLTGLFGTGNFSLASASGTLLESLNTGETRRALNSTFLAKKTVAQNNVTGNNTAVTVGFSTEVYDGNSDYDGVSTFTAPVSGRYLFTCMVAYRGIDATSTSLFLSISGVSPRYGKYLSLQYLRPANAATATVLNHCVFCNCDAGDTVYLRTAINGMGADTADLSVDYDPWFSGSLIT
jgi:hypothetical protein